MFVFVVVMRGDGGSHGFVDNNVHVSCLVGHQCMKINNPSQSLRNN